MKLRENACNVTVTLPNKGILDRRKYGEALGKGEGLSTGIPDYLPKKYHNTGCYGPTDLPTYLHT